MEFENPYQSPQSLPSPPISHSDFPYRRYPTWRFWVQLTTCLIGIANFALLIQIAVIENSELDFALSYFGLLLGSLVSVGLASGVLYYWRAPAVQSLQPTHAWKTRRLFKLILGLSIASGILTDLSVISLVHICWEGTIYWHGRDDISHFLAFLTGALVGSIVACLGFGIWADSGGIRANRIR